MACAAPSLTQIAHAAGRANIFRDVELEARLWQAHIDVCAPEPPGFTSLGMVVCREDPELAAYAWNSTGYAIGASPTLRSNNGAIDDLGLTISRERIPEETSLRLALQWSQF